jgi:hypothetical protein
MCFNLISATAREMACKICTFSSAPTLLELYRADAVLQCMYYTTLPRYCQVHPAKYCPQYTIHSCHPHDSPLHESCEVLDPV